MNTVELKAMLTFQKTLGLVAQGFNVDKLDSFDIAAVESLVVDKYKGVVVEKSDAPKASQDKLKEYANISKSNDLFCAKLNGRIVAYGSAAAVDSRLAEIIAAEKENETIRAAKAIKLTYAGIAQR